MIQPAKTFVLASLLAGATAQLPTGIAPQDRARPIDVTRSAGLQPAGPGRLVGGGHRYMAEFDGDGLRFIPALGMAADSTRFVGLRAVEVARGSEPVLGSLHAQPSMADLRASYRHSASITERFDVGVDAVEVSWRFEQRPAGGGDLVVRYALTTNLSAPTRCDGGGLSFFDDGVGGVSIGGVTGIDADGRRVRGRLDYANGTLAMSLPAAFVDDAAYPIVLDPAINTLKLLSAPGDVDSEPDVASVFIGPNQSRYLAVWLRTFSATLILPRGQRLSGTLFGNQISFGSSGVCGRPRVAGFTSRDRFGLVFTETINGLQGIRFAAVDGSTGSVTHQTLVAPYSFPDRYRDPDIGGSITTPLQFSHAFVTCYRDDTQNEIRAREVYFDQVDNLLAPPAVTIWADTGGVFANSYTQPAMSRQSRVDGRFLLVARRYANTGPQVSVAASVWSFASGVEASTSFDATTSDEIRAPDCDGQNGSWLVAWERTAQGSAPAIRRRAVAFDGTAFSFGSIESQGGAPLLQTSAPTVCWAPVTSWVGFRNVGGLGQQASLRLAALDTTTNTWCNDVLSFDIATSESRVVAAHEYGAGVLDGERGWMVFADGGQIHAQWFRHYASQSMPGAGGFANLGGDCGGGGDMLLGHDPGIGSWMNLRVRNAPPTALLAVFNLAAPHPGIVCGACVWTPFGITSLHPLVGGEAQILFPIPCVPSLIGSQYHVQWTTFDPQQNACALFPGAAVTDRYRMTIGI